MHPQSLRQMRDLIADPTIICVSFDVFDTFLLRRCTAPDGVYESAYGRIPLPHLRGGMVESFVQNRQLAEHKARLTRLEENIPPEVGIDEIYDHMAMRGFGLTRQDAPLLAQAELMAELDLCLVNSEVLDLFIQARSAGKRVGFLSDTYWPAPLLQQILGRAAPGLSYDFLYASCDHGYGKAAGLFRTYLEQQGISPQQAAHLGDNPVADVMAPGQMGVHCVHYPQAPKELSDLLQRESTVLQLLQSQTGPLPRRLDGGLTVLRRLAAGRLPQGQDYHQLIGTTVLGPVMTAFHRLIERRLGQLQDQGRRVSVLFLARDAFLPMRVWDAIGSTTAHYVDISRRITLVGCADDIEPLRDLFKIMRRIDARGVASFLKIDLPSIQEFFNNHPNGICSGRTFADALPDLISPQDLQALSRSVRESLLEYLSQTIPDFADSTDLMLVDLGYAGTIQRTLRRLFDVHGIQKRLHGTYLISVDDNFSALPDQDSVCALIDDAILPPMAKRALLRNIAVIEQLSSAPVGSVSAYDGTTVLREDDVRQPPQLAFCAQVQDSAVRFAQDYASLSLETACDPLSDPRQAQIWGTVILGGFLLFPGPESRHVFGSLDHDVNLGSRTLLPMINGPESEALVQTMAFPTLFALREPPMWLSGSLLSALPLAGYAYALTGFGLMAGDMLADSTIQTIPLHLIDNQDILTINGALMLNAMGQFRIRVPIMQRHMGGTLALPLQSFVSCGLIRGITVQHGGNSHDTMTSRNLQTLSLASVRAVQTDLHGPYFRATGDDAHLVFSLPDCDQAMSVLTISVEPLSAE